MAISQLARFRRLIGWGRLSPVLLGLALALAINTSGLAQQQEAISFDFTTITPQLRQEVDARALRVPEDSTIKQNVQFYSGLTGWLLSQAPMSAVEEVRRSETGHAAVIKTWKVVPTPSSAKLVMAKLVAELPAHLRFGYPGFSLTVLDQPEWYASTVGGGHVYISKPYLEALLAVDQGGQDMLAFVLARQLGHICRFHCRRGYQLVLLKEELDERLSADVNRKRLKQVLLRALQITGGVARFLYTQNQVDEADLFALHLCRNAGFKLEQCLDVLRGSVVLRDNVLLPGGTPVGFEADSFTDKSALRRLRRLRMEIDGRVNEDRYGLFRFDEKTGKLKKVADGEISAPSRAIVLVHGMESNLERMHALMRDLLPLARKKGIHLLGFQYPSDASLSRMGSFLESEIQRVSESAEEFDFVCHSAGGLVFRYYAEHLGGRFDKAIFLGTPHAGSDIAGLQSLLELKQFFGDLQLGYPQALQQAITDGQGQMGLDLQPGSLFFRFLNRGKPQVKRYSIVRGQALSAGYAVLIRTSLVAVRRTLRRQLTRSNQQGLLRNAATAWIDQLRMPVEIYSGDFAVTLQSAALQGVGQIKTLEINHLQLVEDPDARRFVRDRLFSD